MYIFVTIGNSDDKLTQAEWSEYVAHVSTALHGHPQVQKVHGQWLSESSWPWQSACWCIEINDTRYEEALRMTLGYIANRFGQDSVAWAEAQTTYFIQPNTTGFIRHEGT